MKQRGPGQLQKVKVAIVFALTVAGFLFVSPPSAQRAEPALPARPVVPGVAGGTAVGQLLDRRFTIPASERSIRVVKALTADLDADGDIDAIAATSTGKVVVWINVGRNRLERRMPVKPSAGETRVGRPNVVNTATPGIDTGDNRWLVQPSRRHTDTPPLLSVPWSRVTDRMVASPQFSLRSRAPPSSTASPL